MIVILSFINFLKFSLNESERSVNSSALTKYFSNLSTISFSTFSSSTFVNKISTTWDLIFWWLIALAINE